MYATHSLGGLARVSGGVLAGAGMGLLGYRKGSLSASGCFLPSPPELLLAFTEGFICAADEVEKSVLSHASAIDDPAGLALQAAYRPTNCF